MRFNSPYMLEFRNWTVHKARTVFVVALACLQDAYDQRGNKKLSDNKPRKYEAVYIVRPNLDDESVDRTVAGVEEYIKGFGGTLMSTDKKGRRRLAYEVNKMRDGFYVMTRFEAKPENVAQLKRMMMISEEIIRSLIVVLEEAALETSL
jgi:small subunit ribosomal protein S6